MATVCFSGPPCTTQPQTATSTVLKRWWPREPTLTKQMIGDGQLCTMPPRQTWRESKHGPGLRFISGVEPVRGGRGFSSHRLLETAEEDSVNHPSPRPPHSLFRLLIIRFMIITCHCTISSLLCSGGKCQRSAVKPRFFRPGFENLLGFIWHAQYSPSFSLKCFICGGHPGIWAEEMVYQLGVLSSLGSHSRVTPALRDPTHMDTCTHVAFPDTDTQINKNINKNN